MTETDQQLLVRYAKDRAEDAFAEIVRRYLDLVHSAALRQVRSHLLAEEVAQSVFVDLARESHRLKPGTIVPAWLYQVTRRTAVDVVRRESRRQAREQVAAEMNAMNSTDADWSRIEPLLDEAMASLDDTDRAAVLLRYFENKSLREVGQALGSSDDAAQKRVGRAVERLRTFLSKRGVMTGTASLVAVVSAHSVQAAPAGLAAPITGAAISAAASHFVAHTTQTIVMTTIQKTLVSAVVVAALGFGIYETRQNSRLRSELTALREERATAASTRSDADLSLMRSQSNLLAAQNADLSDALAAANADKVRLDAEAQRAKRSAELFKALAEKSGDRNSETTNDYPTARHVMAGIGRLARIAAQVNKEDDGKLSPEEIAAKNQLKMAFAMDAMKLAMAAKQYGIDNSTDSAGGEVDRADKAACVLYGALDLDSRQFGEVYGLMQGYMQKAGQINQRDDGASAETKDAELDRLNEQAKAEVEGLLNPEQVQAFTDISPNMRLIDGFKRGPGISFKMESSSGTTPKPK